MTTFIYFALASGIVSFVSVFYYISHVSACMEADTMLDEAEVAFQKFLHNHGEEPK